MSASRPSCIRDAYTQHVKSELFKTNDYGFVISQREDTKRDGCDVEEADKWLYLLENRERMFDRLVRKYIYAGVPIYLKYKVWKSLTFLEVDLNYNALKCRVSGYENQIHVDIQRTFRQHAFFAIEYGDGQCSLFNILVAFANKYEEIGYCQGMSSFAALILMYFPEEEAFKMFVSIFLSNNLFGLFDKKLSKFQRVMEIQLDLFERTIPGIYRKLMAQNLDISTYTCRWYITLFTRFNIELVVRIWDLFIYHGFAILFYVSVAIHKQFKYEIVFNWSEDVIFEKLSSMEDFVFQEDRIIDCVERLLIKYDIEKVRRALKSTDPNL